MKHVTESEIQAGRLSHAASGWDIAWASLKGAGHDHNEDVVAHRTYGLAKHQGEDGEGAEGLNFGVADGVGSGALPFVASSATLDYTLAVQPTSPRDIERTLYEADGHIATVLGRFTSTPGASMFAGCYVFPDGSGWFTRVGDSRVWQLQLNAGGQSHCVAVTEDQTYAYTREEPPPGGRLTDPSCMLGCGFVGATEVWPMPDLSQSGAYLLLATDGLHKGLSDEAIAQAAAATPFERLPNRLCALACQSGSNDDITVLVARRSSSVAPAILLPSPAQPTSFFNRILNRLR